MYFSRSRRILGIAAALCAVISAADMPRGLFHGTMVGWQGTPAVGVLTARNASGAIQDCTYDSLSYFEAPVRQKINPSKLEPGDPLEIVTDHQPGSRDCYIRILHVVDPTPPARRPKPVTEAVVLLDLPRGDRNLSGVIVQCDARSLTLRNHDGDQTLLIRGDTNFIADGTKAETVPVNTRVAIRAGPNLHGDIEAYRVMWGSILDVH